MNPGDIIETCGKKLVAVAQRENGISWVAEVIKGHGWDRDKTVPTDYIAKYTNTYWYVADTNIPYEIF